jgi:hypothetical protein
VPPSDQAGRLLALGREHPDRLAMCLDTLEARAQDRRGVANENAPAASTEGVATSAAASPPAQETPPVQEPPAPAKGGGAPRRVKKLTVTGAALVSWLTGRSEPPWLHCLPHTFEIVRCFVGKANRKVTLTLCSKEFPPVAEGEPIPVLEWA